MSALEPLAHEMAEAVDAAVRSGRRVSDIQVAIGPLTSIAISLKRIADVLVEASGGESPVSL